jgi:hypothetical protein
MESISVKKKVKTSFQTLDSPRSINSHSTAHQEGTLSLEQWMISQDFLSTRKTKKMRAKKTVWVKSQTRNIIQQNLYPWSHLRGHSTVQTTNCNWEISLIATSSLQLRFWFRSWRSLNRRDFNVPQLVRMRTKRSIATSQVNRRVNLKVLRRLKLIREMHPSYLSK